MILLGIFLYFVGAAISLGFWLTIDENIHPIHIILWPLSITFLFGAALGDWLSERFFQ